jgi:K+-transporting ATPase KdpF subunit
VTVSRAREEIAVDWTQVVAGGLAAVLLVYLLVALLAPEKLG